MSTHYAIIEFSRADGPVVSYLAEYAITTSDEYSSRYSVDSVQDQEKYRITQFDLIPGKSYFIRILPQVEIWIGPYSDSTAKYGGQASESVQVSILNPGQYVIKNHLQQSCQSVSYEIIPGYYSQNTTYAYHRRALEIFQHSMQMLFPKFLRIIPTQ